MAVAPKPAKPAARGKPAKPAENPDILPGDHVYATHPERGPIALHVRATGKDGFRGVCDRGEKHGVPFAAYLGHKARGMHRYDVVEQGADGSIVRDQRGATRFIAGELPAPPDPPASRKPAAAGGKPEGSKMDDPLLDGLRDLTKALQATPTMRLPDGARLLLKAGTPIKGRAGLVLTDETDKAGHQIHRWEKTGGDAPAPGGSGAAPMKHGDTVGFKHGQIEGKGKIIASGADGATLQDESGREHKVRHEHLTGPVDGGGDGIPDKGAYPPRADGEDDKAYLKRHAANLPAPKLPEDHGRYFNMDGKKTRTIPMDQLVSTKSDEENQKGGNNSPKFMAAAAAGVVSKRDPINVKKRPDGKYDVTDGNGTFTGAKAHGWKTLPVQVDDDEAGGEGAAAGDKPFFKPEETQGLPEKASQPFKDQKSLYDASMEGLDQFATWLNRGKGVATQAGAKTMTKSPDDVTKGEWDTKGAMLFIGKLKSAERAAEKVNADYKGDWSQLKDTVRGSIAVDSVADLHTMLDKLKQSGMKLSQAPKDRFSKPTKVGYRDMLLNVTLPNGLVGELQLHVKSMLQAKGEGHHHYETERTLDAKEATGGTLSDEEKASREDARAKQRAIYDKAWQQASDRVSGGAGGMMAKAMAAEGGFDFFDHEGAKFRRAKAHGRSSVDDILDGNKWTPYTGADKLKPAYFGDEIDDPLAGGGNGETMAKAEEPLLLLPTRAGGLAVSAPAAPEPRMLVKASVPMVQAPSFPVGAGVRCAGREGGFQVTGHDPDGRVSVRQVQDDPKRPVGQNFDDAVVQWIDASALRRAPEFDARPSSDKAPSMMKALRGAVLGLVFGRQVTRKKAV